MKRVTMNVVHEGQTMYELGSFDINDTMAKTISAHATMAAQLQAAMRELELLSGDRAEITEAIRSRDAAISALESKLSAAEARIGRLRDLAADASSGTRYIRQAHGELYGVGWDRVEEKRAACEEHNDLTMPQAGTNAAQPQKD